MPKPAPKPIPDGMNSATIYLWFNGNCEEAIHFYEKAFDAKLAAPIVYGQDGNLVMHAMIQFGDTNIMMSDVFGERWEKGPVDCSTASMFLYVNDCDAVYNQAIEHGAEIIEPMMDAFWGDRMGKVKDPFGHCWAIASLKWVLTEEEIEAKMKESL